MALVASEWHDPAVQTLVDQNTTGGALGCRRSIEVEVGGLEVGCANLGRWWQKGLAASGETELVQHGAGGNKAGHAGQIDQAEHTGYLKRHNTNAHLDRHEPTLPSSIL